MDVGTTFIVEFGVDAITEVRQILSDTFSNNSNVSPNKKKKSKFFPKKHQTFSDEWIDFKDGDIFEELAGVQMPYNFDDTIKANTEMNLNESYTFRKMSLSARQPSFKRAKSIECMSVPEDQ